jgi:hypothetical protein
MEFHIKEFLNDINKKHSNPWQPIFEGFTNSLEAIKIRKETENFQGKIIIKFYSDSTLFSENFSLNNITIEDNGIGFNDEQFKRFCIYKDSGKGFNNKGSGRFQLVHYFNKSYYKSTYFEENIFKERVFSISKLPLYLKENSITKLEHTREIDSNEIKTTLNLNELIRTKDKVNYEISIDEIKQKFLDRYLLEFCLTKSELPEIVIQRLRLNGELINDIKITPFDIPDIDQIKPFVLNFKKLSDDMSDIEDCESFQEFEIKAFKVSNKKIENKLLITSKNQVIDNKDLKLNLNCLSSKDLIEGERFLFLLSSKYFDDRDSDLRDELKIPRRKNFKEDYDLFDAEEIFLEDIEEGANETITSMYDSFKKKAEEKKIEIDKLKNRFLLNEEVLNSFKTGLSDSPEKILNEYYKAEAKHIAKGDAEINKIVEELENLNTSDSDYEEKFKKEIDRLVREIPLQNRTALTHYVARRRLVLEVSDKILKNDLIIQNTDKRKNEEELLHNLIFRKKSKLPELSDLWLINEDFLHFSGSSESELKDLEYNGVKIFKDDFSADEKDFLENNRKHLNKRTDILLFPNENKCLIIELKAPNVDISDHLNQINKYAALIRNFTKDEFQFDTFYGYLIGEKFDEREVRLADPKFKIAYNFDFLFKPFEEVAGLFNNRKDGSIYTEVIKYSTLFERAKMRNKMFIDKLTNKDTYDDIDIDEVAL